MGERSTCWLSTRWAGLISDQWCVPTRTNRDHRSLSHGHTPTVRPCQTSSNGGAGPCWAQTFRRQTFRSAQASLSRQNKMAALPRATPRSSQRSSQGQHTFACSATFQRNRDIISTIAPHRRHSYPPEGCCSDAGFVGSVGCIFRWAACSFLPIEYSCAFAAATFMRMTPLSMIGSSFGSVAAFGRLFILLR